MFGSNRFCHFGGWRGRQVPSGHSESTAGDAIGYAHPMTSDWTTRAAGGSDRQAWEELFRGYCDFYQRPSSPEQLRRAWSWIEAGTIHCLLAVPAASPQDPAVGLAHVRPCPSPLRGEFTGYLDDLFVAPAARGTGAFEALMTAIRDLAATEGWANVRWITAADNARAQGAYDRVSTRTEWVTYQLDV